MEERLQEAEKALERERKHRMENEKKSLELLEQVRHFESNS